MHINKYKQLKTFHFASRIRGFNREDNSTTLIFGNFGAMNLGDESILAGEISEIRKMSPSAKISVVSRYPQMIRKIHKDSVNALPLRHPFQILKAIWDSKQIIIGGGGLFNKNRSGIPGYIYQMYFMVLVILIPKILNKKIYLLGIGIYENMNKVLLKMATILFRLANLITVRDFHSYKLLKRYNVNSFLYKDNSYLMDMDINQTDLNKILNNDYSPNNLNVGLSLRMPFTKNQTEYLVDAVSKFMIKNKGATFWFYSLDSHSGRQNDRVINNLVIKRVKKYDLKIKNVPNSIHPKIIFSTFNFMDKLITMRLHSMIFADRLSIPFVGISYDIKCSDFLKSIGKNNFHMDKDLCNILVKF